MISGKSLVELAQEVQRQAQAINDFIVPTNELRMTQTGPDDKRLVIEMEDKAFGVSEIGHDTLGERLGIPAKYYDKMRRENPELLCQNVNGWAMHESNAETSRMVRTLDGNVRAVLSDRYSRRDNYDFLNAILPALQNVGNLVVQSAEVTERRMYVQLTFPEIKQEYEITKDSRKVGDVVQAGLLLTNSEVGYGCREIRFLAYTLSCLNGMVVPRELAGMRTRHIGGKLGNGQSFQLSDEAQEADSKAFALATRDMVRSMVSREHLGKIVSQLQEANARKITGDVPAGVKQLASTFLLSKPEEASVLDHLIRGGDLSQYGMLNAVTRTANDLENYDRAVELEEIGGKVLNLNFAQARPFLEARAEHREAA